jgi:hypothetical protein
LRFAKVAADRLALLLARDENIAEVTQDADN